MFRFSIRDVLWLTVVVALCGTMNAQEPAPTLKELMRQAAKERTASDSAELNALRSHMAYHTGAKYGNTTHCLVVSWFRGNAWTVLRYTVTEQAWSQDVRCIYNHASQNHQKKQLSPEGMEALRELLPTLPESLADPPIERAVCVSFQINGEWRTEIYDNTALPVELEAVIRIIGERFETIDRHKNKTK